MKIIYIYILILVFTTTSCRLFIKESSNHIEFYPTNSDVYGWKINKNPSYQNVPGNSFINEYNLKKYSKAEYKTITKTKLKTISVEIYETKSFIDAYGIISRYRKNTYTRDNYEFVKVYLVKNSILFQKGEYSIIIKFKNSYNEQKSDFVIFTKFIYNAIKSYKKNNEEYLSIFKQNSEPIFYRKTYINNIYFNNLFVQNYKSEDENIIIFYTKYQTEKLASKYFSIITKKNKYILYQTGSYHAAFINIGNTLSYLSVQNKLIYGIKKIKTIKKGKELIYNLSEILKNYNELN